MSIEGLLGSAGVALLAVGVVMRAGVASRTRTLVVDGEVVGRPVPAQVGDRSSPSWWVSTVALWLGVAMLGAAGLVLFAELGSAVMAVTLLGS